MSNAKNEQNKASLTGWDSTIIDAGAASGDVVYAYVWDMKEDWLFMLSAEFNGFMEMSSKGKDLKEDEMQAVIDRTTNLITEMSVSNQQSDKNKNELGILLALYSGKSSSWNSIEKHLPGMHFIVLNYQAESNNARLLRPFASMPTDNHPLEVNFLQSSIKTILASDKARHPEWFLNH